MARTPFKQRSSPVKGKLQDFFNNVGSQLEAGQKDRGIFSEKGKAEKKSRKAGESKFQADVRRAREKRRAEKKEKKTKTTISADFKKDVNSPTNTKPGELKVNKKLMATKVDKPDLKNEEGTQTFKQAFAAARKDGKKKFTWKGNPYTTELKSTTYSTGRYGDKLNKT